MSAIYSLQNSVQDVIRSIDLPVQNHSASVSHKGQTGEIHGKKGPQFPGHTGQKINPEVLKKQADQLNQVMHIFNYNIRMT